MPECLFCKIEQQQVPSELVYEDDEVIAFDDINPQAPHHVLIVPRKHISTLNDIEPSDQALIGKLVHTAKKIAAHRGLAETGYRVLFNCNSAGGQAVFHIHLHLLGGRQMTWPPG